MIPLSQIIENCRTRYEASSVRWLNGDIADSINDGLDDLSEETRFYERHVSVPVSNLRNYYDLRGWLPESALGVTSVWSSITEDWLVPESVMDLRSRWEQSVGPPRSFFMRGFYWMVVWPKPAATTGFHRVYFPGLAPHFDFPQAVLYDLPDDYIPALEDYSLYDMAVQDGEVDLAMMHWGNYVKRATALKQFVERRTVTARTLKLGWHEDPRRSY